MREATSGSSWTGRATHRGQPSRPLRSPGQRGRGRRRSTSRGRAALVRPPVPLARDVSPPSLAEIGRADDDDLQARRPGLVASPRTGRDAHRIPLLELDDLVIELHPATPAQDHVHLLLRLVRVAIRKAIAGRDALVAQAGSLEIERLGRQAELKVRRAVEPGPDVLQILLEVPERERHGRNPMGPWLGFAERTACSGRWLCRWAFSFRASVAEEAAAALDATDKMYRSAAPTWPRRLSGRPC